MCLPCIYYIVMMLYISDKEFIDIIGREIEQIPVNIIEDFKQLLESVCYAPGDFVESDHTLQCDDLSCTIGV